MKKAFLDLDGTLLDSKRRHEVVLQEILCKNNLNIDIEDYLEYKANGHSTKAYLMNQKLLGADLAADISKEWVEKIELDSYLSLDCWYPDSESFLSELHGLGFEIVLLTARVNKNGLQEFLNLSELAYFFDSVKVVSPVNANKNKKEFILGNLGEMNIVVGDTEGDYIEKTDDIELFLLNRGFRNRPYWDEQNVYSYDNLHQVIKEIRNKLV